MQGAAGGAAIAAIAGDAGKGAAIGATVGAVSGRRKQRMSEQKAKEQAAQQTAQTQQQGPISGAGAGERRHGYVQKSIFCVHGFPWVLGSVMRKYALLCVHADPKVWRRVATLR